MEKAGAAAAAAAVSLMKRLFVWWSDGQPKTIAEEQLQLIAPSLLLLIELVPVPVQLLLPRPPRQLPLPPLPPLRLSIHSDAWAAATAVGMSGRRFR